MQGSPDAPVTLMVYGDYECPFTRKARTLVRAALRRKGEGVRYVFRNFPLAKHPHAFRAAEAAEAAGAQEKFWQMHDLLFDNQWALENADLVRYATQLGLDLTRFASDMDEHAHADRVQADLESGSRLGVRGTPAFFINGRRQQDLEDDIEVLLAALEAAA
jgi:protein-disulfide isomerase